MSKGVSEIISAVLVLAIGVTMAGVFSGWLPGFAEETTGDTVEAQTQDMECENADIRVSDVEYDGVNQFTGMEVQNTGRIRLSNGLTVSAINNSKLMNQTEVEFLGVDRSRNITVDTSGKPDKVLVTGEGCPDLGKDMIPETLDVVSQASTAEKEVHLWMPSSVEGLWVNKSTNGLEVNYTGHSNKVFEVSTFSDGRIVSSGDEAHIWDPRSAEDRSLSNPSIKYTGLPNQVARTAVLKNGKIVSSSVDGNDKGVVHVWDPGKASSGEVSSPDVNYTGHGSYYFSNSVSPPVVSYGDKVISAAQEAHIWDPDNADNSGQLSNPDKNYTGHPDDIFSMEKLESGNIVSGDLDGEVHVWDPTKSTPITSPEAKYAITSLPYAVEGLEDGRIATGYYDPEVHIWDPGDAVSGVVSSPEVKYTGHSNSVTGLLELSDGRIASACSPCNEVHVWEPREGTLGREDAEIIYNIQNGPAGLENIAASLE